MRRVPATPRSRARRRRPTSANAYLAAGLVDELLLEINPVVADHGRRLFYGVGPLNLEQASVRQASLATHVRYRIVRGA